MSETTNPGVNDGAATARDVLVARMVALDHALKVTKWSGGDDWDPAGVPVHAKATCEAAAAFAEFLLHGLRDQ